MKFELNQARDDHEHTACSANSTAEARSGKAEGEQFQRQPRRVSNGSRATPVLIGQDENVAALS